LDKVKYLFPNILTFLRIVCTILALMAIRTPELKMTISIGLPGIFSWVWIANNYAIATILFILAGITDALDGPLARRLHAESAFGHMFDHTVDIGLLGAAMTASWGNFPLAGYSIYWAFLFLEGGTIATSLGELGKILGVDVQTRRTALRDWKKGKTMSGQKWPNMPGRLAYGFFITAVCIRLLALPSSNAATLDLWWAIVPATIFLEASVFAKFFSLWQYWCPERDDKGRSKPA
jgi:phosphatidylglycerophosphate synthase